MPRPKGESKPIRTEAAMDRLEAHVQAKADKHSRHLSSVIHPLRVALWAYADHDSISTPGRSAFFCVRGWRYYLGYNPETKFIELREGGQQGEVSEELTGRESVKFINRMFRRLIETDLAA